MSHMESSCRKNSPPEQLKEIKQENYQEKLLRRISCIRWPLWRKSTHLDGFLHPSTSGRELIHSFTPRTSMSTTSGGDENLEKEFSLLVPHEEQEASIGVHDELMNAPLPSQQQHRRKLLALDAIHPHMDWVEEYMSHMDSSCRKMSAHDQWKEAKQANCQEKLLRNISCIRWLCGGNPHSWMDACTLYPVAGS